MVMSLKVASIGTQPRGRVVCSSSLFCESKIGTKFAAFTIDWRFVCVFYRSLWLQ